MMLKECMGFIRFVALLVNNNYRTIIVITGLFNFAAIHLSTLNKNKKTALFSFSIIHLSPVWLIVSPIRCSWNTEREWPLSNIIIFLGFCTNSCRLDQPKLWVCLLAVAMGEYGYIAMKCLHFQMHFTGYIIFTVAMHGTLLWLVYFVFMIQITWRLPREQFLWNFIFSMGLFRGCVYYGKTKNIWKCNVFSIGKTKHIS